MGLQVAAPGWGAEQRPSSKKKSTMLLLHPRAGPGRATGREGLEGGAARVSHCAATLLPVLGDQRVNVVRNSSNAGQKLQKPLEYWPGFSRCHQESMVGPGRDKGDRTKTNE